MLLLPLLLYVALPLFLLLLRRRNRHGGAIAKNPLPPSPWRLPFIGNLHQLGGAPLHQSLHHLSSAHGPVMLLHIGNTPALVASSPAAACDITKTHDLSFASRPFMIAPDRLFYNSRDMVFAPYGDYWRRMRKACTVHLLSTRMVEDLGTLRKEEVSNMVTRIADQSQRGPVDLGEILDGLSNAVVGRAALGRTYANMSSRERKELCETVEEMSMLLGVFHAEEHFPWMGHLWSYVNGTKARLRRCSARADRFLERTLQEHRRRSGGEGKDFVDELLSMQKEDEDGLCLKDENIKAIILDMIAAGTDASHVMMEWVMSELINNPETLKKLQDEVRRIGGEEEHTQLYEARLAQLEYLNAVIKESLRLHPPAPLLLPRECTSEAAVVGYRIPPGTRVMINVWSMGRDPENWEEPEEFRPERFVGGGMDLQGHDHRYMPFGSGRRMCPGVAFGTYLVRMALAGLMQHFDWETGDGGILDMEEVAGISARRRSPLVLVARPHTTCKF